MKHFQLPLRFLSDEDFSGKRQFHVLNLGAGVQSTTLALLFADGSLMDSSGSPIRIDCAIFADTQEEPEDEGHSVYSHLEWLKAKLPYPVIVRSAGKLGDHLLKGVNSSGGRFASIPAFTLGRKKDGSTKVSKTRRQCTRDYKICEVEKGIRRDLLGLKQRQLVPKDVVVHQYIGISLDESGRMLRAQARQREKPTKWARFHYPLIESLRWTRADCRAFLADKVPHRVPRSACVFCPFHDNEEWQRIKERNGRDWKRAVEIDRALRIPGNVVNRKLNQQLFLHRACVPLDQIDFTKDRNGDRSMAGECQGMCGS